MHVHQRQSRPAHTWLIAAAALVVAFVAGLLAGRCWLGGGQQRQLFDSSELLAASASKIPLPAALLTDYRVVDLSVLISEALPSNWATNPVFQRWTFNWFAPRLNAYGTVEVPSNGAWYGQRYLIDEHTGTQTDFPAHFIPPPDSGLPFASEAGLLTGDRYPLSRLMGPAVVVDVRGLLDKAENGRSPVIQVHHLREWQRTHGPIMPGEVVLFHSGYTDAYYQPYPAGQRLVHEPLVAKSAPGWPAPEPAVMDYLFSLGVWHLGIDSPSMGSVEDGQQAHVAGLQHGMSWEENLIGLGRLPPRGAVYLALPLKVVDMSGGPTRAVAFVPNS